MNYEPKNRKCSALTVNVSVTARLQKIKHPLIFWLSDQALTLKEGYLV
jgi:hypothetical protein